MTNLTRICHGICLYLIQVLIIHRKVLALAEQEQRKHFKEFKKSIPQFEEQFKQASAIYLWTERGALLHAKSLNTDKAWEVHDFLIDTYFRV